METKTEKIMLTVEEIQQAIDEKKYIISVIGECIYLGIPKDIGINLKDDTVVGMEWELSSETTWVDTCVNIHNIERVITEEELYNTIFEFTQVDHFYPTYSI